MSRPVKIYIPFYTTYHHIYKLARAVEKGATKVNNVQVNLYQIPETLNQDVLKAIKAPPKPEVPVLTPQHLTEADGLIFGMPTRFGMMPSQVKAFWDACGGIWAKGLLNNKLATSFVSTQTQHGGQESTHLSLMTTYAHFGMIYVPLGYNHQHLYEDGKAIGGSPYGASTIAGKTGQLEPKDEDLEIAEAQGERFANVVAQFVRGEQK